MNNLHAESLILGHYRSLYTIISFWFILVQHAGSTLTQQSYFFYVIYTLLPFQSLFPFPSPLLFPPFPVLISIPLLLTSHISHLIFCSNIFPLSSSPHFPSPFYSSHFLINKLCLPSSLPFHRYSPSINHSLSRLTLFIMSLRKFLSPLKYTSIFLLLLLLFPLPVKSFPSSRKISLISFYISFIPSSLLLPLILFLPA